MTSDFVSTTAEERAWAAGAAAQLRMVQASFADEEPARREAYLSDELEQLLDDVPTAKRPGYLGALLERFPMPQASAAPRTGGAIDAPAPPAPAAATPAELASRVVDELPRLEPALQARIAERLRELGLTPQPEGAVAFSAEQFPPELQRKLPIAPEQGVDYLRALKLLAVLVDSWLSLDQLVWNVWKNLAPSSVVRREVKGGAEFRRMLGSYLAGDPEVSTAQVTQLAEKSRQLTAALLAGIGATGETFARQYLSRFSPLNIQQLADTEPGFLVGPEQKCWRKYTELFDEVSGVKIEQEIARAISEYAEQLILGGRQKTD